MLKWIIPILIISSAWSQSPVIDQYIRSGLRSNLALKQQEFSLEQSRAALDEARGMYFPVISLISRYSRAGGGRTIEFPAGDLINPVYQTINELLAAAGQPQQPFPVVENETFRFLREKEHDTRAELIQPLFKPSIYQNHQLKKNLWKIESYKTDSFKRNLIEEIKKAYFNYLAALRLREIFLQSNNLVNENVRTNQRLFQAEKVTQDAVLRAETELLEIQQQIIEAENRITMARSYLNFLINEPLDTPIQRDTTLRQIRDPGYRFDEIKAAALQNREELKQITAGIDAAGNNRSIAGSEYFPGLIGVATYGFQGETYRFSADDDYWMASLVLEWNLFRGFQDKARVQQAYLEIEKLISRREEMERQIALDVRRTYDNYVLALKKIELARQGRLSAQATFDIVNKKYEQGMIPLLEFLDSQTTLTNAELNLLVAYYDFYNRIAELEQTAALINLDQLSPNQ